MNSESYRAVSDSANAEDFAPPRVKADSSAASSSRPSQSASAEADNESKAVSDVGSTRSSSQGSSSPISAPSTGETGAEDGGATPSTSHPVSGSPGTSSGNKSGEDTTSLQTQTGETGPSSGSQGTSEPGKTTGATPTSQEDVPVPVRGDASGTSESPEQSLFAVAPVSSTQADAGEATVRIVDLPSAAISGLATANGTRLPLTSAPVAALKIFMITTGTSATKVFSDFPTIASAVRATENAFLRWPEFVVHGWGRRYMRWMEYILA